MEVGNRITPSMSSWLSALIILIAVIVMFGRSVEFDFINYDDPVYVYENEMVARGVTVKGTLWAFTEVGETNLWHPATWISHMLDVEIFGVKDAGGHHALNVFWHAIGSLGLFFLLRRITGSVGLALFLALLWALHPQRVQSVLWISERKDVLSGAFVLWSWYCWERWSSERGAMRKGKGLRGGLWVWYVAALGLFMCAGLSKPSVVGLPIILGLREMLRGDNRLSLRTGLKWIGDVVPFAIVSTVVAVVTIYFQRTGGMADVTDVMPFSRRMMLMPVSLWWYIKNSIWPMPGELWVYPPVGRLSDWIVPGLGLLSVVSLIAIIARRNRLVWLGLGVFFLFWLPVSGIVPVSFYFVADRYSYLIQLGLLIVFAGVIQWLTSYVQQKKDQHMLTATAVMIVMLAGVVCHGRVGHWQNSESLFTHECAINPRSLLAPIQLGIVREEQGRFREALALFEKATQTDTESGLAVSSYARILEKLGRMAESEAAYQAATQKKTLHNDAAFRHLARLRLLSKGDKAAEQALQDGLKRFPSRAPLMVDLGSLALGYQQNRTDALKWYNKALEHEPGHADAMQGKAAALIEMGRLDEGRAVLLELLRLHPERHAAREFLKRLR